VSILGGIVLLCISYH